MTEKNEALPKGWKWVKLGDVCELQNGYAFKSNTFTKQGVPVIKMGNIGKDFHLRWEPSTLSYLPEEFLKIYESFVVAKNDLLITLTDMSPSGEYLGTVALYTQDIPALLNQRVGRFYKISEQVDSFYLYFCLCSGDFRKYATYDDTGNLQKNTNPEYLYKFQLPLPPLPEQKRIVAILNEQMAAVEKARAAAEAQLQAAKTLPAAYLREVFDSPEAQKWKKKKLGDVLELRRELIHPKDKPKGSAIFVGLEHIQSLTGNRIGSVNVEMSELKGRKPKFHKNDIVYGYLRPYLNKVWIAEFDGLCSVEQYVFSVISTIANSEFVAWFMRSPIYLSRAPLKYTPAQLPRIRTDEVVSVEINLPSLKEQEQVVNYINHNLSETERICKALQDQLDTIKQLPAALLRQAFNGEL